ncbi:uncharacterized protein jarid2a [Oncorhynchus tshawytscha]|uniref:uncharacterized protein jarid2a n=1 Tax=Oncorhynchus tshawytscha TaxID=74940 RepID=UPI001C3DEAEC|nr:uncharacterized protein jarid2a [Oncorhynchus tshawytscha]
MASAQETSTALSHTAMAAGQDQRQGYWQSTVKLSAHAARLKATMAAASIQGTIQSERDHGCRLRGSLPSLSPAPPVPHRSSCLRPSCPPAPPLPSATSPDASPRPRTSSPSSVYEVSGLQPLVFMEL